MKQSILKTKNAHITVIVNSAMSVMAKIQVVVTDHITTALGGKNLYRKLKPNIAKVHVKG